MSKYDALWAHVQKSKSEQLLLSFADIRDIAGVEIDHSFLNAKKELAAYGYSVVKISLKEKTVLFGKVD